jgi:hypothetical protein
VANRQQPSKQEKRKSKVNGPKTPVAQTSPFARALGAGSPKSAGRKKTNY